MLKSTIRVFGVLAAAAGGFARADSSCATSAVFKVDSGLSGERRSAASFTVGYAPEWSTDLPGAEAQVVVLKVEHADTAMAVTNVVVTGDPGRDGTVSVLPGAGGLASYRLLHRVEIGGEPVGETLVCDIAIGVESLPSDVFVADSRTDALQCAADAGAVAPLVYSTDWATNGSPARVVLTRVRDRYRGDVLQSSVTTELLTVSAPAEGVFDFRPTRGTGGTFRLLHEIFDPSGYRLDVAEAVYRFKETRGAAITIR